MQLHLQTGSLQVQLGKNLEIRSPKWALNPMTSVTRDRKEDDTGKNRLCEDEDRDWRDADTAQGTSAPTAWTVQEGPSWSL